MPVKRTELFLGHLSLTELKSSVRLLVILVFLDGMFGKIGKVACQRIEPPVLTGSLECRSMSVKHSYRFGD